MRCDVIRNHIKTFSTVSVSRRICTFRCSSSEPQVQRAAPGLFLTWMEQNLDQNYWKYLCWSNFFQLKYLHWKWTYYCYFAVSSSNLKTPPTALMGTWSLTFWESPIHPQHWLKSAISQRGNVIVSTHEFFFFHLITGMVKLFSLMILCCVFYAFRVPDCRNALSSPVTMRIPHSNAFIDLNKDFTAGKPVIFSESVVFGFVKCFADWIGSCVPGFMTNYS